MRAHGSTALRRGHLSAAFSAALAGSALASCATNPVVDVNLEDPLALGDSAAFAQVALFDGTCPAGEELARGNLAGALNVQTVAGKGGFSSFGDLGKQAYGFAALLRQSDCGVIAFGCTNANLEHHRHINIKLSQKVDPPLGACAAGLSCEMGVCTGEATEAGVDDTGTDADATAPPDAPTPGCKLDLVAAHGFEAAGEVGAVYAGPDVVATTDGFMVLMHRMSADGTDSKGLRIPIDDTGAAAETVQVTVPGCAGSPVSNGVAGAWHETSKIGLMAVATPACGADPGNAYIANFGVNGSTITEVLYPLPAPIKLAPAQAAAVDPAASGAGFIVSAITSDLPVLYRFDGIAVLGDIEPVVNNGGNSTFARVASSTGMLATLADSSQTTELALTVRVPGALTSSTSAMSNAAIAGLGAWGNRALAVVPEGVVLSWKAVDSSGDAVNSGTLSGGPFNAADVAAVGDYVFVAGGRLGALTVFRLENAGATLSAGQSLQATLKSTVGDTSLTEFLGNRVAIAAARNRVVVAWLNTTVAMTSAAQIPGGYAVLACDE